MGLGTDLGRFNNKSHVIADSIYIGLLFGNLSGCLHIRFNGTL
jgi:hypothetical protein